MKFLVVLALCLVARSAFAQTEHDHTPKRGGQLMPVAGDTLHVEVLWPEQRRIKVFVYDANVTLLPPERLAAIKGHVVIGDRQFALTPSAQGFLEARVPTLRIPAAVRIQIAVSESGVAIDELPVTFAGYSVEIEPPSFILPPTPIPNNLRALLAALRDDQREAQSLLDGGNYTMGYAPAVRARDRLLALEPYIDRLPGDRRGPAQAATLAALRAAWLLHVIADNALFPAQTVTAFEGLRDALDDVFAVFGEKPAP